MDKYEEFQMIMAEIKYKVKNPEPSNEDFSLEKLKEMFGL